METLKTVAVDRDGVVHLNHTQWNAVVTILGHLLKVADYVGEQMRKKAPETAGEPSVKSPKFKELFKDSVTFHQVQGVIGGLVNGLILVSSRSHLLLCSCIKVFIFLVPSHRFIDLWNVYLLAIRRQNASGKLRGNLRFE